MVHCVDRLDQLGSVCFRHVVHLRREQHDSNGELITTI